MDRRQFLQAGVGAASSVRSSADSADGQAQSPAAPGIPRPTRSSRSRASWCSTRTRGICSGCGPPTRWPRPRSRWCAAACARPCRPYPGHIDPAQVAQELPAFVKRVRSHGLRVTQIKGPAITRRRPSRTPKRSSARRRRPACTHYSLGGYTYDLAKPLAPQLDAIKVRLDKFVRLNQKHKHHAGLRHRARRRRRSAASCSICCRS